MSKRNRGRMGRRPVDFAVSAAYNRASVAYMGKELDITIISETLGAAVSPFYDEVAGDGYQATLGKDDGVRSVDVRFFPDTRIARVATGLTDLTLRRAELRLNEGEEALDISGARDDEWANLLIYRNGTLILTSAAQRQQEGSEQQVPKLDEATRSAPAQVGTGPAPESRQNEDSAHPRVTLTGRIGTAIRFRTTRNGTIVATFPLAVHGEGGQTTWYTIRTFGDRAKKLQGTLLKGQEIEVVGYVHVRDKTNPKTGETRQVEEIYAAVVKKPGAKEDASPKDDASGEATSS